MILPGFPVALASAGVAPFSLSGSWETGLDGWTLETGALRLASIPRTGSWAIRNDDTPGAGATHLIADGGGLTITASVWTRAASAISRTRVLQYRIGSGSYTTLATVTNSSTSYVELSGSFASTKGSSVTIRFADDSGDCAFDDWSISGA
jgi:hypothetical protein